MTSRSDADVVTVARRELHDLVYRCSRVSGIDAGTATEVATRWTEAAIVEPPAGQHVDGFVIHLRSDVFDCLTHCAAGFLVSEAILDEASSAP